MPAMRTLSQLWQTPVRQDHRTGTLHAAATSKTFWNDELQRTLRLLRERERPGAGGPVRQVRRPARNATPARPLFRALLASAYALRGAMEPAAAELANARRLVGDDRYSSIVRLRAGAPKDLVETTYFAGLRKAGCRRSEPRLARAANLKIPDLAVACSPFGGARGVNRSKIT